jgi:hypothetical protein
LVDEPVRSDPQTAVKMPSRVQNHAFFALEEATGSAHPWIAVGEVLDEPPPFEHVGHQPVQIGECGGGADALRIRITIGGWVAVRDRRRRSRVDGRPRRDAASMSTAMSSG